MDINGGYHRFASIYRWIFHEINHPAIGGYPHGLETSNWDLTNLHIKQQQVESWQVAIGESQGKPVLVATQLNYTKVCVCRPPAKTMGLNAKMVRWLGSTQISRNLHIVKTAWQNTQRMIKICEHWRPPYSKHELGSGDWVETPAKKNGKTVPDRSTWTINMWKRHEP